MYIPPHLQFNAEIKGIIDMRKEVLGEEAGQYYFSGVRGNTEGVFPRMVVSESFIDKTPAFKKLCESLDDDGHAPSYHVQNPRRFGKTTVESFLRSLLSIEGNDIPPPKFYKKFLRKVRTLAEGKFFIEQKISPAVHIDFGNVSSDKQGRQAIRDAFKDEGVIVSSDYETCGEIFRAGLYGLQELWKTVAKEYPDYISRKVIVTIDEFDHPFRRWLLSRASGEVRAESEEIMIDIRDVGECPRMLQEIMEFSTIMKKNQKFLRLTVVVTILSMANTGLTGFDMTPVARNPYFHGVVGVTGTQVQKAFASMWETSETGERAHAPDLVQRHFNDQRRRDRPSNLHEGLRCICDDAVAYFVARYNGHQFCIGSQDQIDALESLAAPCDVFSFLSDIEVSHLTQEQWAHSWGEEHVDVLLATSKKGQNFLEPLLGGGLKESQITRNVLFRDCYNKSLGFESLLRLFLEYGYLRIDQRLRGTEKRYLLRPTSSVEIEEPEKDIRKVLSNKRAELDVGLTAQELTTLMKLKEFRQCLNQSTDTFDFRLVWQLFLAKANIGNLAKKGFRDIIREYETQSFTVVQLRTHWLHELVNIETEAKYEEEDRDGKQHILRLDILIRIAAQLAALLELKILHGSYGKNRRAAKVLLNIAWNQALRHGHNVDIQETSKVFYAVVYCIDGEGKTEVLFRRGVHERQYEEFLIRESRSNESFAESVRPLGCPTLRRSPRTMMPTNLVIQEVDASTMDIDEGMSS